MHNNGIVSERIATIKRNNSNQLSEKVNRIESELLPDMKRAVLQTKEKGASSWLTVISIHGFALTKSEFRDALKIRYNKQLQEMPSTYPFGQKYDLNHTMNCEGGGFVAMRHNSVRDFEANLLKLIQNDIKIEPALQEIDNEIIEGRTGDEARPDIRAQGVWRQGQNAFFDIRLTNTLKKIKLQRQY